MPGENGEKLTAVVVAGGSGKRMGADMPKQYLELRGVPILVHTLRVLSAWEKLDAIVLVAAQDQIPFCEELINRYAIAGVSAVTAGGHERYASVYKGLLACPETDYVLIQDAVRPFLTEEILERGWKTVREYGSAICGMPSKDTVKLADSDGVVTATPPRDNVWMVQTPQMFAYALILGAYEDLIGTSCREGGDIPHLPDITDDAMILERSGRAPVHMFRGDYTNIKITTPDDLATGEAILLQKQKPPKCL